MSYICCILYNLYIFYIFILYTTTNTCCMITSANAARDFIPFNIAIIIEYIYSEDSNLYAFIYKCSGTYRAQIFLNLFMYIQIDAQIYHTYMSTYSYISSHIFVVHIIKCYPKCETI